MSGVWKVVQARNRNVRTYAFRWYLKPRKKRSERKCCQVQYRRHLRVKITGPLIFSSWEHEEEPTKDTF